MKQTEEKIKIEVPDGVDAEALVKVLNNLEMAALLARQKDSRIIALGDVQESSEARHIKELNELGYKEATTGFPTVRNNFFAEKNIDHIILSTRAWDEFKPAGFALDGDIIDEISDHCLLAIMPA